MKCVPNMVLSLNLSIEGTFILKKNRLQMEVASLYPYALVRD